MAKYYEFYIKTVRCTMVQFVQRIKLTHIRNKFGLLFTHTRYGLAKNPRTYSILQVPIPINDKNMNPFPTKVEPNEK